VRKLVRKQTAASARGSSDNRVEYGVSCEQASKLRSESRFSPSYSEANLISKRFGDDDGDGDDDDDDDDNDGDGSSSRAYTAARVRVSKPPPGEFLAVTNYSQIYRGTDSSFSPPAAVLEGAWAEATAGGNRGNFPTVSPPPSPFLPLYSLSPSSTPLLRGGGGGREGVWVAIEQRRGGAPRTKGPAAVANL